MFQKFSSRIKRINLRADLSNFNWLIICSTIALVVFGIVMVYSASYYNADLNYNNQYLFLNKQIVGAVLGVCALIFFYFFDYHLLNKFKIFIFAVSIVLLIIVFIPFLGVESNGASRWINLGLFTFQPSEIAKFAFVIFCAGYMANNKLEMKTFKGILPVLLTGGLTCLLIILEPNMSITLCVGMVMLLMLFIGGARAKHFAFLSVPIALLVPILIIIEPYRLKRLTAFLNPWASPQGEGYQLIQSLYSLGAGGLFGVGLFNSRQKYLYLPFSESDFIFSIIGEEFGLVGCLALLSVFSILIYQGIKIALNAIDRFGCYLAFGITCIIGVQVLINVAVVTGSIPPTGVPLPFISAGSTSLVVFMGAIGILLNIAKQSKNSFKQF